MAWWYALTIHELKRRRKEKCPLTRAVLLRTSGIWLWLGRDVRLRDSVQWWREVVVGPITEEFCFRACMLPLLLLQVTNSLHEPSACSQLDVLYFCMPLHQPSSMCNMSSSGTLLLSAKNFDILVHAAGVQPCAECAADATFLRSGSPAPRL